MHGYVSYQPLQYLFYLSIYLSHFKNIYQGSDDVTENMPAAFSTVSGMILNRIQW